MSNFLLRLCKWSDKINSLDERYLELEKFTVRRDISFGDLRGSISEFTKIPIEKLSVCIKHQTHGFACAEVLNPENNKNTQLEELNIFENTILFIEER